MVKMQIHGPPSQRVWFDSSREGSGLYTLNKIIVQVIARHTKTVPQGDWIPRLQDHWSRCGELRRLIFFLKAWPWKWLLWGEYLQVHFCLNKDKIKVVAWSTSYGCILCVQNLVGCMVEGIWGFTFVVLIFVDSLAICPEDALSGPLSSAGHTWAISVLWPFPQNKETTIQNVEEGRGGGERVAGRVST